MTPAQPFKLTQTRAMALGAALCAAASAYNLCQSWLAFGSAPLSDPASYTELARASRWFYDSGIREPLPVFLTKLGLAAGLSHDLAVRLPTLALGFLSGPTICALSWPLFGGVTAYAAGMLLSLNPWLGFYSCCGVSSVHAAFFFSIFLLLLMRADGVRAGLWAGVFGGLACLSRLETLGALSAACLLRPALHIFAVRLAPPAFLRRTAKRGIFLASASAFASSLALTLPYPIYQKAQFGSFLYSHGLHARFWINAARGVPPGPQRYEPGPASPSAPLLRDGVSGAPGILARGYGLALKRTSALLRSGWIFAAALCGAAAAFFYGAALIPLALFAALFPVAPIMSIDQAGPGSGVEMRFLFHTLWLWCLCAGLLAKAAVELLAKAMSIARQAKMP